MKIPILKSLVAAGFVTLGSCVAPYGYVETTEYVPGQVIRTLPPGYNTEMIAGERYYTYNDVYYRPRGESYVVVETPIRDRRRGYRDRYDDRYGYDYEVGTVVRTLPDGYRRIDRRDGIYYNYQDTYFRPHSDGYVVVNYR